MNSAKLTAHRWTDSRITRAVAERIKQIKCYHRISKDALYVGNLTEYKVMTDGTRWCVQALGSDLPRSLKGWYTTFSECEKALINYLKTCDKRHRSIYPDSPFVNKVNDDQSN